MKKDKNKMIGMSTGFFLNPLRDLYFNNSVIKTGSIVAGVMLASCGDKDNNNDDNKNEQTLKTSELSDDIKREISNLLGHHPTDDDLKKMGLTKDDIKDGQLTEAGKEKIKKYKNENNDVVGNKNKDDKTIDLNNLAKEVKETLAKQLEVKVENLQDKIDELQLTKDDIDEKGKLTASGLKKKQDSEKPDDKIKEVLKFLGNNKENFINYLNDLDKYFVNKKSAFYDSIKEKNDEGKIKEEIVTLCEKYVKKGKDGSDIQFNNIITDLKNKKFIENEIKNSIKEADFKNVSYKFDKDNDGIKVTVIKDNDKVDFHLTVSAEKLFDLQIKEVNKELYKIKIDIESELPKELTDLLVPKDFSEIKNKAESKIKEVLSNSIKTGGKIDVIDFQKLANTLKQLVEAAKNLLQGKYKEGTEDKFLADVKKLEELHKAFSNKTTYENAIKTEYDASLKSIKDELAKVNNGNLTEKINKTSVLNLDDDNQKIGSKKIFEIVNKYSDNTDPNNVIKDYIDGCLTYGILVDKDGNASFSLYFENDDKIDKDGITAFAKDGKVGKDEIEAIDNDFKARLNATIATLKFGTQDATTDCKTKISSDYITNVLKFESLSSTIDPASITEEQLKDHCGKANCIVTEDNVKDQIVIPVMKKVFGDAAKVKAVFTAVKGLLELKVAKIGAANAKTLVTDGLASIGKDDAGDAISAATDNKWKLGTATRLQTALLNIREKIDDYNKDSKSTQALKDFFKFYFGEVGTGTITDMAGGDAVPADLKWMRLGKALSKWVFSKSASNGYDNEQTMRQNYDGASKALAMSILLNGTTVKMYNNGTKDSPNLLWFTAGAGDVHLDLTNTGATTKGLGGSDLTDSTRTMGAGASVNVNFDNMIICDKLKTKTSAAESGTKDFIVIPKINNSNQWGGTQIVAQDFKDNFDDANNKAIKSDFALLALFLGYFKKDNGKMIDIKVKAKSHPAQDIYVNNIDVS